MSETTSEQIQLEGLTDEQRKQYERNIADLRSRGTPVTTEVAKAIIRALRQQEPVRREGRSDDEQRNRDAVTGKSTVDFLPPELQQQPVVEMQRQSTEIGKNIEEIQKRLTLEGYKPPPGKKYERNPDKSLDINWAEFGWGNDAPDRPGKPTVERMLEEMGLGREKRNRAMEVLLLSGYTAEEVVQRFRVEDNRTKNENAIVRFESLFFPPDRPLPRSSLKLIFNEEFHRDQSFYNAPENMEDFAWQMSWSGSVGGAISKWMVGREKSLFDVRAEEYKDEKGQKRLQGKFYINEAHFREWFLEQTSALYDLHGPDGQINTMDDIKIDKGTRMYHYTFREMMESQGKLFASEDGEYLKNGTRYDQMWLQLQYDESNFLTLYTNDVIYRQASKQGLDEWMKKYEEMSFQNFLTKLGFRSNMLQRLLTGAENFEEGRKGLYDDKYLSDNKFGTAFLEMTLAFYNLGDVPKLRQILGKNSSFFTRSGWLAAVEEVGEDTKLRPRGEVRLDEKAEKILEKAFANGSETITDPKAFQEFINLVYSKHLFGGYQELFLKRAVLRAVRERYGFEPSAGLALYADQAWFLNRYLGGVARNDVQMAEHKGKKGSFWTPNPSNHDMMSWLTGTDALRKKYAAEGGGKPFGTMYTLGQFKATIVDPMNGIVTQDGHSILKIFEELHRIRTEQQSKIEGIKDYGAREGWSRDQIDAAVKEKEVQDNRFYMNYVAKHVQFREDQQIEYVQVHMKPGKEWAHRIINGEGLDFNAFTNFDPFGGGSTVKREVLIKEIQKKMVGVVRDIVKKYNYMNFDDDVRVPFYDPETGHSGFRDGKLWEQEFGYDLLNRKEFWKQDEKGRYIKVNGRHVIDGKKVNNERVTLMKQMFMMELQADMISHQKMNSGDLRFPPIYYLNVIDTLKKMPGQVIIDEFKAHGYDVPESFWTKEDFNWLERRALNGNILGIEAGKFGFYLKWFFSSLFDKRNREGLGFGKGLGIMWKAIFSNF